MRNFHHFIAALVAGFTLVYGRCNAQQQPDIVRDRDGNTYTVRSFPDDRIWMTENLKINIPGSYCYENKTENCNRYGRLYTWTSAVEGCKELGAGWHLPTNAEWQKLASLFGGVRDDSKDSGRTAFSILKYGGTSQFNAMFGGGRDPDSVYRRMEAHGFFWTATEANPTTAWFYNFGKNGQLLNRHEGEKQRAVSVRCVKSK